MPSHQITSRKQSTAIDSPTQDITIPHNCLRLLSKSSFFVKMMILTEIQMIGRKDILMTFGALVVINIFVRCIRLLVTSLG